MDYLIMVDSWLLAMNGTDGQDGPISHMAISVDMSSKATIPAYRWLTLLRSVLHQRSHEAVDSCVLEGDLLRPNRLPVVRVFEREELPKGLTG